VRNRSWRIRGSKAINMPSMQNAATRYIFRYMHV
jgi:hypothetical protein